MTENSIIYLDNSATSFPKPPGVLEFATNFYSKAGINAGRGKSSLNNEVENMINETRIMLSDHFEIDYPECVIFSPSASLALNQIIFGLDSKDKNIYFSPFEHNSVLRPLHRLSNDKIANIFEIPFKENFKINKNELKRLFESNVPDIIILSQTSNVCGLNLPIKQIIKLARMYNQNTLLIVDGAQSSGLLPLSIKEFGIDYYVFSGHKSLYGGYGIAGWIMPDPSKAKNLNPFIMGGTGTESENLDMPDILPSKFEVGSMNLWAIASLNASLKWLKSQDKQHIVTHSINLLKIIYNGIKDLNGIIFYGPIFENNWFPILSFTLTGKNSNTISNQLSSVVATRSGFHCAPLTHKFFKTENTSGTVRISPGIFNTEEEMLEVINVIKKIIN